MARAAEAEVVGGRRKGRSGGGERRGGGDIFVLIFVLFINNGRSKCIWHHAEESFVQP